MRTSRIATLLIVVLLIGLDAARAEVRLAPCFGSNMVLQRDVPAKLVGWADAGETVAVKLGGQIVGRALGKGQAKDQAWTVILPTQKAGPMPDITVEGKNTVTLTNLLAGDVWVCSGQPNMRMSVAKGPWCNYGGAAGAEQEVAAANYPQIRLYHRNAGRWDVCTPESVKAFSAAGYFFGRELHRRLAVPIGLAEGSMGATSAESWLPRRVIPADKLQRAQRVVEELKPLADADRKAFMQYAQEVQKAKAQGRPLPKRPLDRLTAEQKKRLEDAMLVYYTGNNYEGFIAPLTAMAIKGVVWYQGESNRPRAAQYAELMSRLIGAWRQDWGGDLPFLVMQLVNFGKGPFEPQTQFAELREAQQQVADSVPNVGMAVGIDIGLPGEIQPPNKQEVGRRLALVALKQVYSQDVIASGPRLKDAKFERGRAVLACDPGGKDQRLMLKGSNPNGFELAGADGNFVPAKAHLQENTITLTAAAVAEPRAFRYAWYDNPPVSLFNSARLPAAPFRKDAFVAR
jgi:sialate O-acetylesterase